MSTHITLRSLADCFKITAILLLQFFFAVSPEAQGVAGTTERRSEKIRKSRHYKASTLLQQSLQCFEPVNPTALYSLTLCADIPDNTQPTRVHIKSETGHVFLVFSKISGKDSIHNVFGFYPRRPASSLFFKNVRSEILNNGRREYNASVTTELDAAAFGYALRKAVQLAGKKYNINRYNCYDYALEIFNTVSGKDPIPGRHIRFPFIFGKGGSPCGLYADLYSLWLNKSSWAPYIQFGVYKAPVSANK